MYNNVDIISETYDQLSSLICSWSQSHWLLGDGVGINYSLDGSLFDIRRLRTQTKTASDHIFELQYADDTALPSHTAEGLQRNLDTIATAYERAGLVISVKKTGVLIQEASQHSH